MRILVRLLALLVPALLVTAPVTADATPVTGGTATVTVTPDTVNRLLTAGVPVVPKAPASTVVTSAGTVSTTLRVTGGDVTLLRLRGTALLDGGLYVANLHGFSVATLVAGQLDVFGGTISFQAQGGTRVALFDLSGLSVQIGSGTQTLDAAHLLLDSAGAAYLNTTLSTQAFVAGQDFGSFTLTANVA